MASDLRTLIAAAAAQAPIIAHLDHAIEGLNEQIAALTKQRGEQADERLRAIDAEAAARKEIEKLGLDKERASELIEKQVELDAALDEAATQLQRGARRRPKVETKQIEAATNQGFTAGLAAREAGGSATVANPWAPGTPEATAYAEGFDQGFASGTPETPSEPDAPHVPSDEARLIAAGLAEGDSGEPEPPADDDGDQPDIPDDVVTVSPGRSRQNEAAPF